MNLIEVKQALSTVEEIYFQLPNGQRVPSHFHVTEVGVNTRHFIDCGGTERKETKVNFQLFVANDIDHRLQANKLKKIIELSEHQINIQNSEITVEFQGSNTIELYGLQFQDGIFQLTPLQTACLAIEECGIPISKPKINLSSLNTNSCAPGSGCC